MFRIIFCLIIFGQSYHLLAATNVFSIKNTVYEAGVSGAERAVIEQALTEFTTNINGSMPDLDNNTLVQGSAESTIIAAKGLGVDYTNAMKVFLIGWSQGMALNLGSGNNILNGAKTIKGIGLTNHFNLGLNLAYLQKKKWADLPKIWKFDLKETKLFLNFMKGSVSQKVSGYDLGFDIFSLSIKGMTKIKKAETFKSLFFKWGGIDLLSGVEYNKVKLTSGIPIDQSLDTVSGGITATTAFDGTVTLGLESKVFSIPFEVSTSAEFFTLLNFFWGLGGDINLGSGIGSSSSNSDVEVSIGGLKKSTSDAYLDIGMESTPVIGNLRWFFGLNFNFWKMKTNIGLQHSLINGIWGLGSSFNIVY